MSPEISVIIPTHNRASMVVEAVESVLAQNMTDFELIVINDGSTDDTEERLSVYGSRLKYYQQENAGVSAARNRGIKFSSAPTACISWIQMTCGSLLNYRFNMHT